MSESMKIKVDRKIVRERNRLFQKKCLIKDIDLTFRKGEMTLIIGTSGGGKSTLLSCILQSTKFEGKSNGYRPQDIAYIPQFPALNPSETVRGAVYFIARLENLSKARQVAVRKAENAISRVGLLPQQEDRIGTLSGGQKQRVSIAKEIVRDKPIIIADEIDTGLDAGIAKYIVSCLRDITHDKDNPKTTIVVSHNLSNLELYDNVVVLAKGNDRVGTVVYSGKREYLRDFFDMPDDAGYPWILEELNQTAEGGKQSETHDVIGDRKKLLKSYGGEVRYKR